MIPANVIPMNEACRVALETELAWREHRALAREEAERRGLQDLVAFCREMDALAMRKPEPTPLVLAWPVGLWPIG